MIQREIHHEAGTFSRCTACGREPTHVQARGSHSGETFDVRHPTGERHRLECRCGAKTAFCATLPAAQDQWRRQNDHAEEAA